VNGLRAAFWTELLKLRRSRVTLFTAAGYALFPLVDGLFMFILEDPQRARSMGLISVKAQLAAGAADWPSFFQVLMLGSSIGGAVLFGFFAAWVFGREYADHTAKELLATPTNRAWIVAAKLTVIAIWMASLTLAIFVLGLGVGAWTRIPGWDPALAFSSLTSMLLLATLNYLLLPFVALLASAGRGYLPALAWVFLTLALSQIAIVLGWGDWFPWAVPGTIINVSGTGAAPLKPHSLIVVLLAFLTGTAATFTWWYRADQTR
jgi:ABC-2 type transport system permease protein